MPLLALAAVTYLPLLFNKPGQVGADTKSYLYLDPGRLLSDAPHLWDPGIGLGTVTHQNIGYLWPMGPFYWVLDTVGLPDWIAQRLWLASVMFAAGAGVLYLLRALHWEARTGKRWWDAGMVVAALAYALSPYVLDYAARISVILLPWAALPWLIALTIRSLRHGGWRHPALFALVVLTVGAINATSLLLVGIGPLVWVAWAIWVEREVTFRQAVGAVLRIGGLTLLTSLWWIAGLSLQGGYGIPILRYTETYQAVAVTSMAPELLRGLGYWFFYGNDKLGQWIVPSIGMMSWGLPVSYAIPILAFTSAVVTRFRHRAFFVVLIAVGTVVAIGGHPFDDPSPAGSLFKAFTEVDAGLAFRSTARAAPLIVLGTAVLLGAGVSALARAVPRLAVPAAALAVVLVVVNLPATWGGNMVDRNLKRDEDIPEYWHEAAAWLDQGDHQTRALELPGTDFAAYRWGNTVDPVTPGLMDRPYVARELIPYGSHPSANLLNALDRPLQEGTFDPDALAPLARIMGVGDVVLRSDLEYERFRTPRPQPTWQLMNSIPGLDAPIGFGEPVPNEARASLPMIDEVQLGIDPSLPYPPPVSAFPVQDPEPIIRAVSADQPVLLAGDADGLVAMAAAGYLDPSRPVLYSGTYADDTPGLDAQLDEDASLVVTDSNRKRARRWGTVRENEGYTERAGEEPLVDDPSDNRLEVFPDAGDDSFTVSEQRGGATVSATAYGNPVTYTPGDRAAYAMDGDPSTAWRVGAFSEVEGEKLVIQLDEPLTTDHVTLLQPASRTANRFITDIELHFDEGDDVEATLDDTSHQGDGQTVDFGEERTFSELEIEIEGDTVGHRVKYNGISAVGFAEVGLGDIHVEELIRPPVDLLDAAGEDSIDHPLTYLFTRQRTNPSEPVRVDEEDAMRRILDVPVGRDFDLTGEARLSAQAPDAVIDRLVGMRGARQGGVTAQSSAYLAGKLTARASAALDGDPSTAWETPFEFPQGNWVEYTLPERTTVDHLDLQVVADRRHSVPTRVRIVVDGEPGATVDLPRIEQGDELGHTVDVPIDFDALRGRRFRLVLDQVEAHNTVDWYSGAPLALPVGIAEVGLPDVTVDAPAARVDRSCRNDLLTLDDEPLPVRVRGTTEDALARQPLSVTPCGDDQVRLDDGETVLRGTPGGETGFDVDTLQLQSGAFDPGPGADAPEVTVTNEGFESADVQMPTPDAPVWLILGQSHNLGWEATLAGHDLPAPTLINGYANGWLITPAMETVDPDGTFDIHLDWAPQRAVWIGLILSGIGVIACLALIALDPRRRKVAAVVEAGAPMVPTWAPPWRPSTAPVATRPALIGGLVALVLMGVFSGPVWGLLAGVAAVLAARWKWGLLAVRIGAVGGLTVAGVYITGKQFLERYPPDFNWPTRFEAVHWLGLLAVALLVIDTCFDLRARRKDEP